jgi:hypothetical protein
MPAVDLTPINLSILGGGAAFHPLQLGAKLLLWYDFEQLDRLIINGSNEITQLLPAVGSGSLTSSAGKYPLYSATGYNGRPAALFDGTDDTLTVANIGSLPSGAVDCEVFITEQNNALVGDTGGDTAFGWGGVTAQTSLRLNRAVTSGVIRRTVGVGTNAGNPFVAVEPITAGVPHVAIGRIEGGVPRFSLGVDRSALVSDTTSPAPAIGTARIRISGSTAASPTSFWQGPINSIMVTSPLSDTERSNVIAYCYARAGI